MNTSMRISPDRAPTAVVEVRALKLLRRDVAIMRRGDKALFGIVHAGEVLSYCWLDPAALDRIAARAQAIAAAIRADEPSSPEPTPIARRRPAKPKPAPDSPIDPPPPSLIDLAQERNRRQVERLRDRLRKVKEVA